MFVLSNVNLSHHQDTFFNPMFFLAGCYRNDDDDDDVLLFVGLRRAFFVVYTYYSPTEICFLKKDFG